jgi:hypothetical protein
LPSARAHAKAREFWILRITEFLKCPTGYRKRSQICHGLGEIVTMHPLA